MNSTAAETLQSDAPAATPTAPSYFTGTAEKILEEHLLDTEKQLYTQKVSVRRADTNEVVTVEVGNEFQPINKTQLLQVGNKVVLSEQQIRPTERQVVVADMYRMPTVVSLSVLFAFIVVLVGRIRGLSALVGMAFSVLVLVKFLIPAILSGHDPITVSLLGSLVIGGVTVYVAHGFSVKSHIALVSMLSSLGVVAILSYLSVHAAHVVGLGSEEAYYLQFGNTATINLQGLLLGGIILGALGVLDDITVSQVAIVFQLRAAKKDISLKELYRRGTEVGKDHVASLVNTLVLAYAGANLPLFLLFMLNTQVPGWVTLNSEIIVEEIIRTLTGSIGLVLAVPLATFIAAYVALRVSLDKIDVDHHSHH